jgi:DNA-binding NtrC family response regulator
MAAGARFRVLIVDDDPAFVDDLGAVLGRRYDVGVATNGAEALAQVSALKPDVVLLDIALGDRVDGFAVLDGIRALPLPPEVIMLTGNAQAGAVVQAVKAGAFHYVTKPPVMGELVNLTNLAAARAVASRRFAALESQVQRLGGDFVVHDPLMRRVVQDIERVSPTGSTVLIIGESGTGKELVARRVHDLSPRADGPFVAINCGAISEHLIESELFGHVRGAFTDAVRDRVGCFERAEGGTLFLDEVGLAPPGLQVKLLRVLEAREFLRVGSTTPVRSDVRLIAASSSDLSRLVDEGTFKPELFFRLNVFSLVLPPLRLRQGDILPLAEHFLALFAAQIGRRALEFSAAAREYLVGHEWRGNVRDLRNRIERAVIMADGDLISVNHLVPVRLELPTAVPAYDDAMLSFQREYVLRLLRDSSDNVTEAARRAGLSREGLSRMIGRLGLREDSL